MLHVQCFSPGLPVDCCPSLNLPSRVFAIWSQRCSLSTYPWVTTGSTFRRIVKHWIPNAMRTYSRWTKWTKVQRTYSEAQGKVRTASCWCFLFTHAIPNENIIWSSMSFKLTLTPYFHYLLTILVQFLGLLELFLSSFDPLDSFGPKTFFPSTLTNKVIKFSKDVSFFRPKNARFSWIQPMEVACENWNCFWIIFKLKNPRNISDKVTCKLCKDLTRYFVLE